MREIFRLPVGYGDHTDSSLDIAQFSDLLALGQGVCCLEKHITLDRSLQKTDYQAALNPDQWRAYAINMRNAWSSLSDQCPLDLTPTDIKYRQFQKKYAVLTRDVENGSRIDIRDIKLLRTSVSDGISGLKFTNGKYYLAARSMSKGHILQPEDLIQPLS